MIRGNIWLVLQREYMTRVKRRSFILVTLLTPLAFLMFFIVAGLIFTYQSDEKTRILVKDEPGLLEDGNNQLRRFELYFTDDEKAGFMALLQEGDYEAGLWLPALDTSYGGPYKYEFYSDQPLDIESSSLLSRTLRSRLRAERIATLKIEEDILEQLEIETRLDQRPITESSRNLNEMTGVVAAALGGIMGYIMFFVILLFGVQVMRSVTEEKSNRIVEVIISSVRPFDLMLGKILGSSAVSLTQILIWLILIPASALIVQLMIPMDMSEAEALTQTAQIPEGFENLPLVIEQLGEINWWFIVPLFLFYFVAGFLIYSSLFAAIGAALGDDINEGQSLTIPVVVPIVLAVYIMFQAVREPNSSLAIWSSIFPFFSSIVMPSRLAFEPDSWQIGLSMLVTAGTAVLMIWLAGRIYRVGILMYGKKASFRELAKWIFSRS
ncbi:MAG: ABC transporter permease [Saprospiraceae bacterium]|nr:ABC transporter permease [Saprospiraceae bacterium]